MQAVKAEGVEVIPDAVATPAFPTSRIGAVALRHGPANPQMGGLRSHKWFHIIYNHLIVPLLVLCGAFMRAQEDVGAHAADRGRRGGDGRTTRPNQKHSVKGPSGV